MQDGITKLCGMHIEFGTAPDATGTQVPYVLLRMQVNDGAGTVNLAPVWMTSDHAHLLAQRVVQAAGSAGSAPADAPMH